MFSKLVALTGALNFLIAPGLAYTVIADPAPGLFVSMMTLCGFLFAVGAALIWASRDVASRAPVIFWFGWVRILAVVTILFAIPMGLANTYEYAFVVFDGLVGSAYILGAMRISGKSLLDLFLLRGI
jgi:hypothetical protein